MAGWVKEAVYSDPVPRTFRSHLVGEIGAPPGPERVQDLWTFSDDCLLKSSSVVPSRPRNSEKEALLLPVSVGSDLMGLTR